MTVTCILKMAEGNEMRGTSYWSIRRRVRRTLEENAQEDEMRFVTENESETDFAETYAISSNDSDNGLVADEF